MDKISLTKGRGLATNVPEKALIRQVKLRPVLYDKNTKNYRKPGVSENAWEEVAVALESSVTNCKKRWKSLRDTFIKYYRLDKDSKQKTKQKRWHFYNDLKFLQPHVELFRLEESAKEFVPIFYCEENEADDSVRYEIKVAENSPVTSEQLHEDEILLEEEGETSKFEFFEPNQKTTSKENKTESTNESENEKNQSKTTDPDEGYLLSLLPAMKRLTPQQKALVRMGIEKLFYNIEFEPASKS